MISIATWNAPSTSPLCGNSCRICTLLAEVPPSIRLCFSKDIQETTPIEGIDPAPTTVDVIDPTHALYGLTLPLRDITTHPRLGRACVVELYPGVARIIPLAVTNLAISILRLLGYTNIAAACRRLAAQPALALAAVGLPSRRCIDPSDRGIIHGGEGNTPYGAKNPSNTILQPSCAQLHD